MAAATTGVASLLLRVGGRECFMAVLSAGVLLMLRCISRCARLSVFREMCVGLCDVRSCRPKSPLG